MSLEYALMRLHAVAQTEMMALQSFNVARYFARLDAVQRFDWVPNNIAD
ncbi:hypothetical protein V1283_006456 [Bradyrhizobium sp. AZCC 2262]